MLLVLCLHDIRTLESPGTVVFAWVASNVTLQRYRPHAGPEVVEPHLAYSQPVRQVPGVGQSRGEPDHPDGLLGVGGDEVGPGHDHLQHGAAVLAQQVDLVNDDEGHVLDKVPGLPGPGDAVPLRRNIRKSSSV